MSTLISSILENIQVKRQQEYIKKLNSNAEDASQQADASDDKYCHKKARNAHEDLAFAHRSLSDMHKENGNEKSAKHHEDLAFAHDEIANRYDKRYRNG